MKVKIYSGTASSQSTFFLAGERHTESPIDFKLNGHRSLELAEFLRAEFIKVFYRNNRKTTVSFQVARNHVTEQAAAKFVLDHDSDVPTTGLVEIVIEDSRGATVTRWIKDAGVESVDLVKQTGATTVFSYSIVGGKILKTKP